MLRAPFMLCGQKKTYVCRVLVQSMVWYSMKLQTINGGQARQAVAQGHWFRDNNAEYTSTQLSPDISSSLTNECACLSLLCWRRPVLHYNLVMLCSMLPIHLQMPLGRCKAKVVLQGDFIIVLENE